MLNPHRRQSNAESHLECSAVLAPSVMHSAQIKKGHLAVTSNERCYIEAGRTTWIALTSLLRYENAAQRTFGGSRRLQKHPPK